MRLSCGNGSFPLLPVETAIELTALLDFEGFDLVLMGNSTHVRPEDLAGDLLGWARGVKRLLDGCRLGVADVFCVPWTDFTTMAPNHPDDGERSRGRQVFRDMLDLAGALGAPGVTMLPGVDWPDEHHDVSLNRAADELELRAREAADRGLGFSVEPHVGSVCADPADVASLCELAPTLQLTIDHTHFVAAGFDDRVLDGVLGRARHVQTRAVAPDRLQAPLSANTFDFEAMIDALSDAGYTGFVNVEYVWVDWNGLNEVDVVSETVLLRDRLRAKLRGEPWQAPGPTGIR